MKTELTMREVAPYLPFGLKYQRQIDEEGKTVIAEIELISLDIHVKRIIGGIKMKYGLAKPIVHPLSALTKPITHNGETFVPVEKLHLNREQVEEYLKKDLWIGQWWDYEKIEKLIEWHIWIFDQSYFEKGLIIDKKTLEL